MSSSRRSNAPNITIDASLAAIAPLETRAVPALLDAIGVEAEERGAILSLVADFEVEAKGAQDRGRFAQILEEFRAVSQRAYQHVGKPLFLTFVRQRPGSSAGRPQLTFRS